MNVAYCIELAVLLAAAFGLTVLFGRIALPILRAKKAGQPINEYVKEHQVKAGTPTMGGISFVPAFLAVMAGFALYVAITDGGEACRGLIPVALVCLYALGNTVIGFADDYFKLLRRHNEGLTERQKFFLQVVFAAAFLAMMAITGNLSTTLHIPYFHVYWELGWFAYPLYLLIMVGFVNATNITDGLDGLASSICASVALFMVAFGLIWTTRSVAATADIHVGLMGAALLGCVLGFLVYNHHPAKMFMGDTGSLFLGAVIMGCSVMAGELILFVLAGFMFVIEMLSSLLQRTYYKLSGGKRIFKMAPLHHHFEKCGWGEVTIVAVFTAVSAVFCILAFLGGV
jgi:phospho-N-acetylmuramoyl-pentapeptide-transferase